MFRSASINPFAFSNFLDFRHFPTRFFIFAMEPYVDVSVSFHARPSFHFRETGSFGRVWHGYAYSISAPVSPTVEWALEAIAIHNAPTHRKIRSHMWAICVEYVDHIVWRLRTENDEFIS